MSKTLATLLALIYFSTASAQIAIINDRDGFTNIREKASSQSKIVDTLSNGRLVYCFKGEAEGDWLPVDYNGKTYSGYIHKSRVQLIENFAEFTVISANDSILKLKFDSIQLRIKLGKFNKSGRKIKYENSPDGQRYVELIDNKIPWGTDGNLPKNEYKSIQFILGNKEISFNRAGFNDLFEPNLSMTAGYIDKSSKKIYIVATNSDGAGGYIVVWLVQGYQLIRRETFRPF